MALGVFKTLSFRKVFFRKRPIFRKVKDILVILLAKKLLFKNVYNIIILAVLLKTDPFTNRREPAYEC